MCFAVPISSWPHVTDYSSGVQANSASVPGTKYKTSQTLQVIFKSMLKYNIKAKKKKEINGCYINGAREGGRRHPVLLDGKDGNVVGRERMESLGLIHPALPGVTE